MTTRRLSRGLPIPRGYVARKSVGDDAREQIQQKAKHADDKYHGRQFGIREPVASIENQIAEPRTHAEHFRGHQHDPQDADGESHAS